MSDQDHQEAEQKKTRKRRRHRQNNQRKNKRRRFFKSEENQQIAAAVERAVYPSVDEAAHAAIALYRSRFKSERLYTRGRRGDKKEINSRFEFEMCRRAEDGRAPLFYFYLGNEKLGSRVLTGLFYTQNPDLAGVRKFVSRKDRWVDIPTMVEGRLRKIWDKAMDGKVRDYFTVDRILSLIDENPFYPFTQNHSQARKAILEQIPDKISELYPMARSMRRHFILHIGPTNSGKTYDAVQACEAAPRGVYLAPLRLLAMEVAEKMNGDGVACNMITGEEEKRVPGAEHTASTIEMLSESTWYDVAIVDECQMIADSERGWAWTQAILGVAAGVVHACMAPEAEGIVTALIKECGDTWEVVRHERATPLDMENGPFAFPEDVREGDALVVFSRRSVLQAASILEDAGRRVSVIYGALPYEARQAETRKFAEGRTKIVVATDAIGMGMNLPVKRIVFLETQKFDGICRRELNASEVKQIAGRAGRRGYEEKGWVNASFERHSIAHKLREGVTPILTARTAMPPFLANMDRDLSQIMQDWQGIPDEGIYQKTSMSRAIWLCLWLEENCTMEKAVMLRAITIPFDEEDTDLVAVWRQAMKNVDKGRPVLTDIPRIACTEGDGLDTLETKYKALDIYYNLQRSFGATEPMNAFEKQDILICKSEVSSAIIERLKRAKKFYKRCRICGKVLPWNDPYGLCEDCFQAGRGHAPA